MKKNWVIVSSISGAFLILLCALIYLSTQPPKTTIQKEIQYIDRIVEKVKYVTDKSRTETTIKRPDGTVETTITQANVTSKEDSKEVVKEVVKKEVTTTTERNNYSLGANAVTKVDSSILKAVPSVEITGGYRILGDIWVDGGYNIQTKDASVGVSLKFR